MVATRSWRLRAIVAVVLCTLLWVSTKPQAPSWSAPEEHTNHNPESTLRTSAPAQQEISCDSAAVSRHSDTNYDTLLPESGRRPAHIEAALRELRDGGTGVLHGSNSVKIDAEDIARAEANVIRRLPHAPREWGDCKSRVLYEAIKDTMQARVLDSSPIVVDFGCVVGSLLAHAHPLSSVICAVPDGTEIRRPSWWSAATNTEAFPPQNMLWIGTGSVLQEPFSQIYESCNVITVAFALGFADERRNTLYPQGNADLLRHIEMLASAAALTIAAVPKSLIPQLQELVNTKLAGQAQKVVLDVEVIADVGEDVSLVSLRLRSMTRACRKTFGAPLRQWDREQSVSFNDGRISFTVVSVKGGNEKKQTLRVIHPLQYIPSLNLDTLLGLGLSKRLRYQLLGQMIATPRYSDPLPHNWVLGGGGRLLRIDKVDEGYDAKVDEAKGYWGVSTRGYLHLLTYHLCLPTAPNGMPAVAAHSAACYAEHCRPCATTCSYLPKGTGPCEACRKCGLECIGKAAPTDDGVLRAAVEPKCQMTYSSMDSARRVWRRWRKDDERYAV